MPNLRAVREALVRVSRRYGRVPDEAEDLAHDVLLSALQRGLDPVGNAFLRIADGAARRHAAFLARSAARRRARELRAVDESPAREVPVWDDGGEGAPLSTLSPVLRTTLLLLVQGLDKAELRSVLGVTDTALRKRFQALRERAPLAWPRLPVVERTPALVRLRRSQIELLPHLAARGGEARILAAHDPDGHGVIFSEALTRGRRTATTLRNPSDASPVDGRSRAKGKTCSGIESRTSPSSSS